MCHLIICTVYFCAEDRTVLLVIFYFNSSSSSVLCNSFFFHSFHLMWHKLPRQNVPVIILWTIFFSDETLDHWNKSYNYIIEMIIHIIHIIQNMKGSKIFSLDGKKIFILLLFEILEFAPRHWTQKLYLSD